MSSVLLKKGGSPRSLACTVACVCRNRFNGTHARRNASPSSNRRDEHHLESGCYHQNLQSAVFLHQKSPEFHHFDPIPRARELSSGFESGKRPMAGFHGRRASRHKSGESDKTRQNRDTNINSKSSVLSPLPHFIDPATTTLTPPSYD